MTCATRRLRCLLARLARAGACRSGRRGWPVGGLASSPCHVENKSCGGHLGCRQHAGGRPGSVATGCAVASSPEEVRSSPSPTAALPPPAVADPTACPAVPPDAQGRTAAAPAGRQPQEGFAANGSAWFRHAARAAGSTATAAVLIVTVAGPALAQTPPSLNQVLDAATAWLVGLLASLATLFLTVGGIRYMAGATDPGEVEKAKTALKAAAIGYALAALAPLAVRILKQIVGV